MSDPRIETQPRPYGSAMSNARPSHGWRRHLVPALAATLLLSVLALPAPAKNKEQPSSPDDLMIVDCLLPQKVRRLGRNNTFLAPRRPIRTTAVDCRIRGGEYTEPDQANYATSLKVWLPQAKSGDAEAQFYVGQIFEKGLGTTPDYESASSWYQQAAEQDYTPAQISLGYLYEEGLGVARDDVQALNWYRRAAGLAEDLVVLEDSEYQELVAAREQLGLKEAEVDKLGNEIEELRKQLESQSDANENQQATLRSILERLQGELASRNEDLQTSRSRIASLEKKTASLAQAATAAGSTSLADIPFGKFHALVIGNSEYRSMPAVANAGEDAKDIAKLLKEKYNFEVDLLLDADRYQIMSALNDLRQELTTKDHLLVYYAGHGERDANGQTAYWQPVDAAPDNPVNWIPSAVITEHLDLIASNHVFVVADSVFSGLRTRSSVARLPQGMTDEQRYYHIKLLLDKRARLVLSSGGPGLVVPEPGSSSGFATAFKQALESNNGVLEASALYQQVNDQLHAATEKANNLEFATMKWARNDLADFFFVPTVVR